MENMSRRPRVQRKERYALGASVVIPCYSVAFVLLLLLLVFFAVVVDVDDDAFVMRLL